MRILQAAVFGLSFAVAAPLAFLLPLGVLLFFLTFSYSVGMEPRPGLPGLIHIMYRLIAVYSAAALVIWALGQTMKQNPEPPFDYAPFRFGSVVGVAVGGALSVLLIIVTFFGDEVTGRVFETITFGLAEI